MARPSHQAMAAAAAGAGLLLLCGCGSLAAPAAAGSAAGHPTRLASRFCTDASDFMSSIPAGPKAKNLTPTQAQANMGAVLVSTVQGFARLEKEAPAKLREPLKKIIHIYKSDETVLKTTGNMAKASQAMTQRESSGRPAFQQLVTYISVSCR